MTLWIAQPSEDEVTGTVFMMSSPGEDKEGNKGPGLLKNNKGVILNPQPHKDPNDPLNWPMWRRDIALAVIGLYSFVIGGQTPVLAPFMSVLRGQFARPLDQLTYLVGTYMLAMGVGALFFAPTAVLYGKRLIYLVSQPLFFAGCIWAANANSFGSLLGARIICGLGGGPAEALPSTTIAEIYFAHERAYRTGIYTLLMLGGKNLVPLVSGFIAHSLGWHWVFWILAIITGGCWVATFVFVHETWWDRTPMPNRRSRQESAMAERARKKMHRPAFQESGQRLHSTASVPLDVSLDEISTVNENPTPKLATSANTSVENLTPVTSGDCASLQIPRTRFAPTARTSVPDTKQRVPFWSNLAIYTGRKSPDSWWMASLRPFVLYVYPSILFSTLLYGTSVVWLSVIAETISTIFTAEPYNFPSTSVGLLYVATFVGGCLGSAVAGKSSDILVRKMSKWNNGVYEPEFRLVMVAPVMVTVTVGLMGFGWSTFNKDLWIVPAIFLAFLGFGTSLGSTVAITYAVDCYRVLAPEALVSLNFAKNVMGFVFGIFVPIFFTKAGGRTSYIVYGGVEIGLCLLAVPLYHYGKRLRSYRDRHNPIHYLYK